MDHSLFTRTRYSVNRTTLCITRFEVGKTVALFGAVSIILATVLGLLLLHEALSMSAYLGVVTAILAFFILAFVR